MACFLEKTVAADGTPICHEGTRRCRDGRWSACEGVHSYAMPAGSATSEVIDVSLPPENCNDCDVKCFVIRDNLDQVEGGLDPTISDGAVILPGGGLTVGSDGDAIYTPPPPDGGWGTGPVDNPDESIQCVLGTAPDWDCDGIEDDFDPYPFDKPFETAAPAIFLDIAPGEIGTGIIDLRFFLHAFDVYFLVDATKSMQSVHTRLRSVLTEGTFLDASVECTDSDLDGLPNQELKSQGLIGAIQCLLRDARVGAGFYREIPFEPYGDLDETTYEHLVDLTDDANVLLAGVNAISNDRDKDWPDADALAIYSVVTGNGLYAGLQRPGVPPRVGCPAETWGYPCFRDEAIPAVMLFTDSPFHNGPVVEEQSYGYPMNYDPARLGITAGTTPGYTVLGTSHDTFTNAHDLGDVSESYRTYAGDTMPMASDYGNATMSCLAAGSDTAPDAAFTFDLGAPTTVTVTTAGSAFDASIALFNHATDVATTQMSPGTEERWTSALELGQLYTKWEVVNGSTAGMVADYPGVFVGCGATDTAPDAVYAFTLARETNLAIDTAGSAYDTVLSLHSSAPVLPVEETTDNTNDVGASAKQLGDVYQQDITVTGGDTSVGVIDADYSDLQIGCGVDSDAADAVFRFTLSEPTSVRIDSSGSSFNTVLALTDGDFGSPIGTSVPPTNDTQASAYLLGDVVGSWHQLTGATTTLTADYLAELVGCGAGDAARDAVFAFTMSATSTVRFDSSGSGFDTVISIHDGDIDPIEPLDNSANANDVVETTFDLGTVNDRWVEVEGASTTPLAADYETDFIGCGAATTAHDAVYSFDVGVPTTVRIDTVSSVFDTVISLHDAPPPRHLPVPLAMNLELHDVGPTIDTSRVFTGGNTASLVSDYGGTSLGCGATDGSPDVAFKFTLDVQTEVEINTAGSSFDTVLGLYPDTIEAPKEPPPVAIANTNETKATAHPIGAINGAWGVFTGSTLSMQSDLGAFGCGTVAGARDAVFSFSVVGTAANVQVSTSGSSFDTVIGVFRSSDDTLVACDADAGSGVTSQLDVGLVPGSYYVVVKGQRTSERGPYRLGIRDLGEANVMLCDDDLGGGGAARIIAQLLPGTYHVVVKGKGDTQNGAYKLRITDRDWYGIDNRVVCDDDSGGGSNSRIEWDLEAGTYYLVVKGDLGSEYGPYTVRVRDLDSALATSHVLACNDDGPAPPASRLDVALDPGTYWAVVKGKGSGLGSNGTYALEVRDLGSGGQGALIECNDDDPMGGTHSVIERDLAAGTYYAYLKGATLLDEGAYALRVSDAVHSGVDQLACNDDAAGGGTTTSRIQQVLPPGDYWAMLKGKGAVDDGAFSLTFRDLGSANRQLLACEADGTLTTSLAAGAYDLLVKGAAPGEEGSYTITLGNGETTASAFTPPDWDATLNELVDRDLRVMSILNCHDNGSHGDGRECDDARHQAIDMANATDALGEFWEPLVFDIDGNGDLLEVAVLDALRGLARHIEMDVGVQIVFEPDANPGFQVSIEAVDAPGDGCDGPVGLEHIGCVPGSTPTFHLRFTNPYNAPVPLNPADPGGGYWFRADLIADGKYFVTAVPIYIVPRDLDGSVPGSEPKLLGSAVYWQDIEHDLACSETELAEWGALSWTADVPDGTSIEFGVCTADSSLGLDDCEPISVATVTGSGACATDADCASGVCAQNGVCRTITSGSCTLSSECYYGATCTDGMCLYDGPPVSVAQPLGVDDNLRDFLRMYITLTSNLATNDAPTVYDWSLQYHCREQL